MPTQSRRPKAGNDAFLASGLVFLFLLIPLLNTFPLLAKNALLMRVTLQAGYSALMLIGIWGMSRHDYLFKFGLVLALLSVALTTFNLFYDVVAIELCVVAAFLVFSVISVVIAIQHVFGSKAVDRNLICGAICVYLLLGLIWAILYAVIFQFLPGSFNGVESADGRPPMDSLLYFSFVTLASLGYGEITPIAPLARTLAYLEAIGGQPFLAVRQSIVFFSASSTRKPPLASDSLEAGHISFSHGGIFLPLINGPKDEVRKQFKYLL